MLAPSKGQHVTCTCPPHAVDGSVPENAEPPLSHVLQVVHVQPIAVTDMLGLPIAETDTTFVQNFLHEVGARALQGSNILAATTAFDQN